MAQWQSGYVYVNVNDPLVAWLVYRGEIVSAHTVHESALSFWATGRLKDKQRWEKELTLERVREADYADVVSRLTGFYVFPDLASARAAALAWQINYFRPGLMIEVGIKPDSRVSRYDSEWITRNFDSSGDADWMHAYLRGEPTDSPVWELVIDGRALIYGTELRKTAYEKVKETWPRSMCLLELARLGAYLDSDLGLITAMLFSGETGLRVRYIMNFADADNPGFLERIASFDGPKNTADLYPFELIVPDLREREFMLA
jgi:hypothetical protein